MKHLILAFQFTTRFPIPVELNVTEEDFGKSTVFFPVVGLIIGLISYLLFYLFYNLDSKLLGVVTAILGEMFITGGLHYDGLGDTFDGLYSGKSREGMLEVMKDSRLGTHGVLAVVSCVLLKVSLLMSLKSSIILEALVLTPVFSRLMIVLGGVLSKPAREKGLGNLFIKHISAREATGACLLTLSLAFYFLKYVSLLLVILSLVFSAVYVKFFEKRIKGMTGDTLGALNELGQVVILFSLFILNNY